MKNVLQHLAHYTRCRPHRKNYFSIIVLPTPFILVIYVLHCVLFVPSDESFDLNANDVQVIEDPISPEQSIHIDMKSSSEDSENR